jgi:hypothetical protein
MMVVGFGILVSFNYFWDLFKTENDESFRNFKVV